MFRYVPLVAAIITTSAYAAPWIRVTAPHFEIYTDAGERTARRVLTQFEQARLVLSPDQWRSGSELPVRVILFSSEREYSTIRPSGNVPGFFQSGPDRDYIAMLAGAELSRIILHEYTHSVLNHSSALLPQWLEEGLAELYSTLSVSGKAAVVGAPIAGHIAALERQTWLTGAQLSAVNQKSEQYNEASKTGIFYAESWALTHMLTFGEKYRGKLAGYIDALSQGKTADQAFEDAFGVTIEKAESDLHSYLRSPLRTIEIALDPSDQILLSEAISLDPALAHQTRGEILLLMGRDREAQRVYEDVVRRYPRSPAAQTGLAVIAMRDRDYERARACFERAMALGADDGSTYFEYAMLLRDTGADPELVTRFLEKAVAANPAYGEAHFLLGIRASDAGRYSDAVEHLKRATEVLPRQAYFWQALSFAYYKLGRGGEARSSALRALRSARTEHESGMARSAMQLADEPQKMNSPKQAGVITPDSWKNPKGDRTVSGQLTRVDCAGSSARLHLRTDGGILELEISDSKSVLIRGGSGNRTLSCGVQPAPERVLVEYVESTKRITSLEFQ